MTVTITTSLQGRINGKTVSIALTNTISNVTAYMDRTHRLVLGTAVQSLNDDTPRAPNMDNAEICYIRLATVGGSRSEQVISSVGGVSEAIYGIDPGTCVDFYRAEAGGIISENATATTSALEFVELIEQNPNIAPSTVSLFVAFKPIS